MKTPGRPQRSCLFLPAAAAFHDLVWRPAVDVYRTPDGWLAKFELAGVRPSDVQIEIRGRNLLVRGARRDWIVDQGCCYHTLEISYSEFERCLEFPADLEAAQITTEYQEGMFLVRVSMKEKSL
jgi:HSP20 family protein